MSKKKSNKELPPKGKTDPTTVTAKVSCAQKEYIDAAAKRSKMTTSAFIRSRCFGYEPKARITPEQEALLAPLIEVRSDLRKFFAAYNGMPRKERDTLLRTAPFVLNWVQLLAEIGNQISDVLDSLMRKNELPPAIPKTEES